MVKMSPSELFSVADLLEALEGAKVGVWDWDMATNYLRWSDVTLRLYGMERHEFNNTFESFLPRVLPEDQLSFQRTIENAIATRSPGFDGTQRVRQPDGSLRWLEGRGRVITNADGQPIRMLGTVIDATERLQSEPRLRESDERLRLFTTHATDYVYDADVKGEVAVPNIVAGSFERTTGLTADVVRDLGGWAQVIHPEDRERAMMSFGELSQGRSVVIEYRIVDGRGRTRWMRDRVVPILDEAGALSRLVGGVTDITEQRALEGRLLEAQRMEALARLAAGVAHDFNNLLTVLTGELSFLREPSATPQSMERGFAEIDATIDRAARLTASLLAFGRKQTGPLRVVDLADTLRLAQPMLTRGAGERVRVHLNIHGSDLRVAADPNDLHMVFLNLTLNARDAMPEGGAVVIEAGVEDVLQDDPHRPPELKSGRYVSVSVKDTGLGIPAQVRAEIFQPFFTTKGPGGTGLGLPTCLGIVQRYGGVLFLKESSAEGTTFQIFLPLSEKPATATVAEVTPREGGGHGEHVLLVEDDDAVRTITQRGLSLRGYRVTGVASSEEALALGEALQSVDLLLTDVRLPGISGLDLVAKLRASFPSLRVLVISGHVEDPAHQAALSAGKHAFLPKPFSLTGLLHRLNQVFERV